MDMIMCKHVGQKHMKFTICTSYYLHQGSQTHGPRAACGPRRHYLWPATHYLKFGKIGINSSRFIHFYIYSIFSQRYLSNSRSAILATAGYFVLLVTQQNYYFSHLRLLYF